MNAAASAVRPGLEWGRGGSAGCGVARRGPGQFPPEFRCKGGRPCGRARMARRLLVRSSARDERIEAGGLVVFATDGVPDEVLEAASVELADNATGTPGSIVRDLVERNSPVPTTGNSDVGGPSF